MIIQTKAPKRIAAKQAELRARLWPGLNTKWLWHRKERAGFTTVPRCMSLICAIIDDLTPGQPASKVYLDLWMRAFDESFVTLARSKEMAFHSGFNGQRAERTWKQRMRSLADLGFIDIKPGPSGEISYALIKNPYLVVKALRLSGNQGVTADSYNALVERCIDIGETSLDENVPAELEGIEPPTQPSLAPVLPDGFIPVVAPSPVQPATTTEEAATLLGRVSAG